MTTTEQTVKQFQVGKIYFTRSACDHECVFERIVVKRTDKFVTTDDGKSFKIRVDGYGEEWFREGSYSMAPVFRASRMSE